MILKSFIDKALSNTPRFYVWLLLRRNHVDKNKLAFLSLITKGQIILDVGANFGSYTRVFSNIVGSKGRVIAFEPVRGAISRFLENVRARDNVELIPKGLGANESTAKIYVPCGDLGQSSLAKHEGGSWRINDVQAEEILMTTLDRFVAQKLIEQIDFIKVDIEGAEADFLSGAEVTLRRFKPLVYIEINWQWLRDFGESPTTVCQRFSQLGYCFAYTSEVADKCFRFLPAIISAESNGDFLFTTTPLPNFRQRC